MIAKPMGEELRNCFSCNGESEYEEDYSRIICSSCGFSYDCEGQKKEQAIKFWNTRASDADLERLRRIEENIKKLINQIKENEYIVRHSFGLIKTPDDFYYNSIKLQQILESLLK